MFQLMKRTPKREDWAPWLRSGNVCAISALKLIFIMVLFMAKAVSNALPPLIWTKQCLRQGSFGFKSLRLITMHGSPCWIAMPLVTRGRYFLHLSLRCSFALCRVPRIQLLVRMGFPIRPGDCSLKSLLMYY